MPTILTLVAPNGARIELTRTIHNSPSIPRYTWPTFQFRVNGKTLFSGSYQAAFQFFKHARELCATGRKE